MVLKFAVLGTGHWAAQTHAVAIANHPETELVAVWGRRRESAAALAEPFGARGFDDVDAALAGVDAVAIALPPDIQAQLAIRAARAGKHLLLEKPLALDVGRADEVVAAVKDGNVANIVFFTSRFVPEVSRFLDELAATGGWDGARVSMLNSIFGADSPYRNSTWRRDHGGLWDLGPHALSLLVPVLGPVVSVTAAPGPHEVTHVILGHAPGEAAASTGSIPPAGASGSAEPAGSTLSTYPTGGAGPVAGGAGPVAGGATTTMSLGLAMPAAAVHHEFTFYGSAGMFPAPVTPAEPTDPVTSLGIAIDELLEQVATGRRDHPCGVGFARDVVAVLAAAQKSRDEGVTVRL